MSRSIGDTVAHSVGCSCEPDITQTILTPNDKIVLLASDGIWEFLSGLCITTLTRSLPIQCYPPPWSSLCTCTHFLWQGACLCLCVTGERVTVLNRKIKETTIHTNTSFFSSHLPHAAVQCSLTASYTVTFPVLSTAKHTRILPASLCLMSLCYFRGSLARACLTSSCRCDDAVAKCCCWAHIHRHWMVGVRLHLQYSSFMTHQKAIEILSTLMHNLWRIL